MPVTRDTVYDVNEVVKDFSFLNNEFSDNQTSDPVNSLLLGSVSRTSVNFGRSATVKAGEDIRPALESLKSAGGGTLILLAGIHRPTYDIVGASKINIIGEGIDQTIIDFGGSAYQIVCGGASSTSFISNFELNGFTVTNSSHSTGSVYIFHARNFTINAVKFFDNTTYGIHITSCEIFTLDSCSAIENTTGFYISNTSLTPRRNVSNLTMLNCTTGGNTIGYDVQTRISLLMNCLSGFVDEDSEFVSDTTGFSIGNNTSGCFDISFIGCRVDDGDTTTGFKVMAARITLISCSVGALAVGAVGFNLDSGSYQDNLFLGCSMFSPGTGGVLNTGNNINSLGNSRMNITEKQETFRMINGSGGSLTSGTVLVHDSSSPIDSFITTTTSGDDRVMGVLFNSANSGSLGFVITSGLVKDLKVNGTTDIAIGDFLCTHTVAGIAVKAGSGDMVFAIALEAYTTDDSSGVIDALIISPRKI